MYNIRWEELFLDLCAAYPDNPVLNEAKRALETITFMQIDFPYICNLASNIEYGAA